MFKIHKSTIIATAAIILSACRSGQVDQDCLWGPMPNHERLLELRRIGVKTIVVCRLNPMKEKEKEARALGMNFVHLPTGLFKSPSENSINKFIATINDPSLKPIYVTDQVARDRAQFFAAIYGMSAKGWSSEEANWHMYRNGLRHWWPWFYKYKNILGMHAESIRRAREAHANAIRSP